MINKKSVKAFIISLIIIGIFLLFSGKSFKIIRDDTVSINIIEDSLTNTGARFLLKNNTQKNYSYFDYSIEKKVAGGWYRVNPFEFLEVRLTTLTHYPINSQTTKEIVYEWDFIYGKLKPGKYRIVQEIWSSESSGKEKKHYTAAEFIIK